MADTFIEPLPQEPNLLQVSKKKDLKLFLYISKGILSSHSQLNITALGASISNAMIIAETLCRKGLTKWKRVQTSTVGRGVGKKKIKIFVELERIGEGTVDDKKDDIKK